MFILEGSAESGCLNLETKSAFMHMRNTKPTEMRIRRLFCALKPKP